MACWTHRPPRTWWGGTILPNAGVRGALELKTGPSSYVGWPHRVQQARNRNKEWPRWCRGDAPLVARLARRRRLTPLRRPTSKSWLTPTSMALLCSPTTGFQRHSCRHAWRETQRCANPRRGRQSGCDWCSAWLSPEPLTHALGCQNGSTAIANGCSHSAVTPASFWRCTREAERPIVDIIHIRRTLVGDARQPSRRQHMRTSDSTELLRRLDADERRESFRSHTPPRGCWRQLLEAILPDRPTRIESHLNRNQAIGSKLGSARRRAPRLVQVRVRMLVTDTQVGIWNAVRRDDPRDSDGKRSGGKDLGLQMRDALVLRTGAEWRLIVSSDVVIHASEPTSKDIGLQVKRTPLVARYWRPEPNFRG